MSPLKVTVRGVFSSLTVSGAAFPLRPAPFVQDPLNTAPAVSAVGTWAAVQATGPLIESAPVVVIVTSLVYQSLSPGVPAVTASVAVGGVLSSLTVRGAASPVSPAALVQEPLNTAPAVSTVWY